MKPEKQRERERLLRRVMRDITDSTPEEPFPGDVPADVENVLWDYAMGLLEPAEERHVVRLLARSESVERTLLRIRSSMKEAGMADPIELPAAARLATVLEIAREKASLALAPVGHSLSSVAGVVVKLADGLALALEERLTSQVMLSPQPVMLAEEEEEEEEGERGRVGLPRIELKPGGGLSVSMIHLPNGRLDIQVATEPPLEGRVKLARLVPTEGGNREEPTGHSRRLDNGCARLAGCPEGVLKIILPDGRETVICVQPAEA